MNIPRLGMLVMALALFFFLMTPYEMTADQNFLVWASAWGFLVYGVMIMFKHMRLEAVSEAIEKNVDPGMVDDVQFDFYLSQKTWARTRFRWVTRVTLGLVLLALGAAGVTRKTRL